ncbi:hypothetical protein [Arthrobacter sp. AD-310]
MSNTSPAPEPYVPGSYSTDFTAAPHTDEPGPAPVRVGTVVWGLIVLALAALIIVAQLGWVTLNGTYVLIGLMIGAGAALVVGGLLSARKRDNDPTTRKS